MPGEKRVRLEDLKWGDLIRIRWFDASEGRAPLHGDAPYDIPVESFGVYVGLWGTLRRHIRLMKEVFHTRGIEIHYNAVPLGWEHEIYLIIPGFIPASRLQEKKMRRSFRKWRDEE